jgi:hypothetical protein
LASHTTFAAGHLVDALFLVPVLYLRTRRRDVTPA